MNNDLDWLNAQVTELPEPTKPAPKAKRKAPKTEVMQIAGLEVEVGRTHSDETRAKIGRAHEGKKLTEEHKALLSFYAKNSSAETRAKSSAANTGQTRTAEQRANISNARKGQKRTPEHQAKLTAKHQNRSLQTRKNMSAAQIGKVISVEARAAISLATKGKPKSAEHSAKIKNATSKPLMTPRGLYPNRRAFEDELVSQGGTAYQLILLMRQHPDQYYYPHKRKASTGDT